MMKDEVFGFEVYYSFHVLPNGMQKFDYPKEDNSFKILYLAKSPTFNLVASALEEATFINHITGKPFIRTSILYREVFQNAIVKVIFEDNEELEEIDVSKAEINKMNYNLVKIICKDWLRGVL